MRNAKLSPEQLEKLRQTDFSKLGGFTTAESYLTEQYGAPGTCSRLEFEAKAQSWYYGELLRERRKELKMTQKELGRSVGRERAYISRIEQGQTDIQLSTFLLISKALGMDISMQSSL